MPDSLICVKTMADADQIKDTDTFFTALQTQHTFCANILPVNLSDLRLISGNIDWNISLEDLKKLIPAKSDTILLQLLPDCAEPEQVLPGFLSMERESGFLLKSWKHRNPADESGMDLSEN